MSWSTTKSLIFIAVFDWSWIQYNTRTAYLLSWHGELSKLEETATARTIGMPNNEGRWEGPNFEVTSTELGWIGQEAGKNQAILSKGLNASYQ